MKTLEFGTFQNWVIERGFGCRVRIRYWCQMLMTTHMCNLHEHHLTVYESIWIYILMHMTTSHDYDQYQLQFSCIQHLITAFHYFRRFYQQTNQGHSSPCSPRKVLTKSFHQASFSASHTGPFVCLVSTTYWQYYWNKKKVWCYVSSFKPKHTIYNIYMSVPQIL